MLDSPALVVLTGPFSGDPAPKVARNGTNYLVIGAPYYGGSVVVSGNGAILYSNYPVNVGRTLACAGSNFLSTYHGPYGITGLIITDTGTIATNFTLATTFYNNYSYSEAVAGNGQDYVLAFYPGGPTDPLYLCQISATGVVFNTNAVPCSLSAVQGLAGNGNNYRLSYGRKTEASPVPRVYGRVLDGAPVLMAPALHSQQFTLTVDGLAQRVCEIEVSPDLQNWSVAGRLTNQTGRVAFSETTTAPNRFYRARQLP